MLKVYDILDNCEVQSEVRFVWYDYDAEERVTISEEEARGREVKYLYVDDGILYVEVYGDDE
jgi:hypothetical protein